MSSAAKPGSEPVFLIGSSRSGTGVVARLLHANGIFMGADLESNAESKTLQRVNRWILLNAGGGLETPRAIDDLLADPFVRQTVGHVAGAHIHGAASVPFWGWRWFRQPERWGFKDPRTTFTLPIWLDLFPQARVIHVLRHGVDVALSLQRRRQRVEARWRTPHAPNPDALVRQQRVVANLHVRDLDQGFDHWCEYVARARQHGRTLPAAQFHTLKYETLLDAPDVACAGLSLFLGADIRAEAIALQRDRAGAYRWQRSARDFALTQERVLRAVGYGRHTLSA